MVCNQGTEDLKQRLTIILPMFSSLTCLSKPIEGRFLYRQTKLWKEFSCRYNDVIMSPMASQIISLTIVYSTIFQGADQRKHQSSASLAFVRGIRQWPGSSPHKWPVTRKMFLFDDVIMWFHHLDDTTLLPLVRHIATPGSTHCDPRLGTMWPCG